jgi:hypothetical protein
MTTVGEMAIAADARSNRKELRIVVPFDPALESQTCQRPFTRDAHLAMPRLRHVSATPPVRKTKLMLDVEMIDFVICQLPISNTESSGLT